MDNKKPIHWADVDPNPRDIKDTLEKQQKKDQLISEWQDELLEGLDL